MVSVLPKGAGINKRVRDIPALVDLDERFRIMDMFDDYVQVICMPNPPIDAFGSHANDLARLANDGMAELVSKYPDRFPAFIAALSMGDPEAMIAEAQRAVRELGAVGVQVFANVLGKPLDRTETMPLFDLMAELDLPIWIHPARGAEMADYKNESKSHYEIWQVLGWPYETSTAMAHLVFSKLFDKHPNIKIITHHLGAMIPYFEGRVGLCWDELGSRTSDVDYTILLRELKKRPLDYFHMFYGDTAVACSAAAIKCGLAFFGVDKVLFGTDAPFGPEKGVANIRGTIDAIDKLDITAEERRAIYEGNAKKLLKLNNLK